MPILGALCQTARTKLHFARPSKITPKRKSSIRRKPWPVSKSRMRSRFPASFFVNPVYLTLEGSICKNTRVPCRTVHLNRVRWYWNYILIQSYIALSILTNRFRFRTCTVQLCTFLSRSYIPKHVWVRDAVKGNGRTDYQRSWSHQHRQTSIHRSRRQFSSPHISADRSVRSESRGFTSTKTTVDKRTGRLVSQHPPDRCQFSDWESTR